MEREKLIVVGGGLVGAAIAYGAARANVPILLLDQGDVAFRASRGNFGLVWLHSKGGNQIRYATWSREAVQRWPELSNELLGLTGIDVGLRQPGGFWLGFSEKDVIARQKLLARIDQEAGGIPFRMMQPDELRQHLSGLGADVVGGSFCPLDGHANPLKLLHALHAGIAKHGGRIVSSVDVVDAQFNDDDRADFTVTARDGRSWSGERLVLAAGLGNASLAPRIGLHAPVFPEKGQVLVTERLKPFLRYPTNKLRQTDEGSIQIGSTSEDTGLDDRSTPVGIEWLARRAVQTFPFLSDATLVRAWGALRVMTNDGFPIYEASTACPGAYVVTSHSGVTLASVHSLIIGPWVSGLAAVPQGFEVFRGGRFTAEAVGKTYAH
ncbi:FAD-dependent oxidoreductase [Aquamicrobium sp. LC103]|uniref:NAD(P)/FAD-dependent oxidoreductase n=1 Tax=Aquamicrobium sp. LC103 TaxID=1120658 RepID=UPI00063EA1BF|nr:FAD-dependent oxidoreductase [Aquamicrobium sp. LC103]TKT69433.1 FAD-binding oxidoreductase [Aquamicrobium sp. LC103]